jgi:lysyl oxidase
MAAAVAVMAVAAVPVGAGASDPHPVFKANFTGPDGLITNDYATWTDNPLARRSGVWWLDGGSLFRRGNTAWTGDPTCGHADILSQLANGSDKMRVHLRRRVSRNNLVTFRLRVRRFTRGCDRLPAAHWNGVSIYLRRLDGDNFYAAQVSTRDGSVYIEKKIRGRYRALAVERGHRVSLGKWEHVGASVRTNPSGSVTIEVIRNGSVVLRARDRGRGGPPITAIGHTGFRSDNTEFQLDDFAVSRLPRRARAAADPLKPDLVADPPGLDHPRDVLIDTGAVPGSRLLRFDGWIHNTGPGCLHLIGTGNQNGLMTSVAQRLYQPGACDSFGAHTDVPLGNGSQMKYETNDSHEHFHFMAAARYSLWDEAITREVAPASKVGFCLLDSQNVDGLVPWGVFPEEWSHHCSSHDPSTASAQMGLSPGWRDIYEYWLKLQWVDISDVPPGVYRVGAQMDPENRIIEANETNPPAFSAPIAIPGYLARPSRRRVRARGRSTVRLRARAVGGSEGGVEFAVVRKPKHGRLSRRPGRWFEGNSITYRPRRGYHGRDSFTFAARDDAFPRNPPAAKVTLRIPRATAGTR